MYVYRGILMFIKMSESIVEFDTAIAIAKLEVWGMDFILQ